MVILLLSPSLLRLGLLGHYQLNKAEITRLHCINRDKPMLHCEGKCYLSAHLERAQKEQESMEGIFAGWDKLEEWLQPSLLDWPPPMPVLLGGSQSYPYLPVQGVGYLLGVFRPPQCGIIWKWKLRNSQACNFLISQTLTSDHGPQSNQLTNLF